MKEVMIVTGAGQIGMAIARRMGYGKKIVIGDRRLSNARAMAQTMADAGFDTVPVENGSGQPRFHQSDACRGAEARRHQDAG